MKFIKELFEDKLSNEKEEAILNGGYVYSEKENKNLVMFMNFFVVI